MKRATCMFATVAVALIATRSAATTLAWFHFDEKDPGFAFSSTASGIVTNACNAATPVQSYVMVGQNATSSPLEWMPRYSTTHRGVSLYDPVSGQKMTNLASMQFVTGTKSGESGSYYGSFLKVPGTDKSAQPTDAFTVECFVCTTGGTFNTFSPIFGKRNDSITAESWAMYMTRDGKLAIRLTTSGSTSPKITGNSASGYGQGKVIHDGSWHHVAMTYDKATGNCIVYVDYAESFRTTTYKGGTGETVTYCDSTSSSDEWKNALYIGGYPNYTAGAGGRKFNGCIDELRISDVALTPAQFLRLQPTDDDELVRLRFEPHNLCETAISTNANYNDRLYLSAKFTQTGGTVALDANEKYAATLRDGIYAAAEVNGGSYSAATNGAGRSGYVTIANLSQAMTGGTAEVTNHGYTVEAFFKTRQATTGKKGEQCIFKFGGYPVISALLYHHSAAQESAGVLTCDRICFACNDGGTWRDFYSETDNATDGNWHHVAAVNDPVRKQMRFYLDGRLTASVNNVKNIIRSSDKDLYVGAKNGGGQEFDGWIDDVRVTNRALAPHEFLVTHDVATVDVENPTVAFMGFENSYATTPYPDLVGAGEGLAHSSAGTAPTFTKRERAYLLDGTNGTDKVESARCVSFSDSMAGWPYSPLFEQESFTVEFFAKLTDLQNGANVIRYAGGVSNLASTPVWALYRDTSYTDRLCLRIQLVTNGVSYASYAAKWMVSPQPADSKWHHFALTLAPKDGVNTVVELFRDYQSLGSYELSGRLDYAIGKGGRLALGASSDANKVFGSYDALRFSKRVLAPGEFMLCINEQGTTVIVR